ncbi:MAG: dNTP triphosphohydrolase [Planctomycetales bacterium]|nr:dNTP triphosphohydrolase [Planctomycetales bacterium]
MNANMLKFSRGDKALGCSWQQREEFLLAPYAMFAKHSAGRKFDEPPHAYRSPFQRDRDRILHCSAFRRLSGKMQVFTGDMGDYHRTRLTHTHEVAMIARTIGRVLRLNEDLIEALALMHDIGHPPFGHSGEDALKVCLAEHGGFSHNAFALTLVEQLETRYTTYPGLNLSHEVLQGQRFRITHEGTTPLLEVQVVDLADSIAYNAHDVDDAVTLGLLTLTQLSRLDLVGRAAQWGAANSHASTQRALQQSLVHSLIDVQIADLLEVATDKLRQVANLDSQSVCELGVELSLSPVIASERQQLSQFLFDNVYRHEKLISVREQAAKRVSELFETLVSDPSMLPVRFLDHAQAGEIETAVGYYIAGMTDRFCDSQYRGLIELGATRALDW